MLFAPKKRGRIHKQQYLYDRGESALGYYYLPRYYYVDGNLIEAPVKHYGAPLNLGDRTGILPCEYTKFLYNDYTFVEINKNANIKKWLHYDTNQCNTTLITGRMGSGKSNFMNFLINLCLGKGEAVLMACDTFLESRHLSLVGEVVDHEELGKIVVLTNVEFWYHKNSKVKFINKHAINKPNITFHKFEKAKEIIDSLAPGKVVAVYDENLTVETKNKLWYDLAFALNRRENPEIPVVFAHHEASELLPSHPVSGKFQDVQNFANEYIKFRKAEIRIIFAQQLMVESFWRTNQKTTYFMYKQGSRSDHIKDPKKKNQVAVLPIDEVIVEYAGSWSNHNSPMSPEHSVVSKMVAQNDVFYGESEDIKAPKGFISIKDYKLKLQEIAYHLRQEGKPAREISGIIGVEHTTVLKYAKLYEQREKTDKKLTKNNLVGGKAKPAMIS